MGFGLPEPVVGAGVPVLVEWVSGRSVPVSASEVGAGKSVLVEWVSGRSLPVSASEVGAGKSVPVSASPRSCHKGSS